MWVLRGRCVEMGLSRIDLETLKEVAEEYKWWKRSISSLGFFAWNRWRVRV
jgi:hypothetical protein